MRILTPLALAVVAGIAVSTSAARVRVEGVKFADAQGRTFQWRGITAFRLVEMVAHGRAQQASAYLDWAASQRLTVVRVFTMAHHLFKLTPDEGTAALPRLLEMAARRRLHVEVVGLADTAEIRVDVEKHVEQIAAILASHSNAFVEIANEPVHRTQRREVHDPERLRALAASIPRDVPTSLGSIETGAGFAAGSYVTWHVPRSSDFRGWGHVRKIADGASFVDKWKKPVVSDEPIGAAAEYIAGRRDNNAARFRAAGLVTRLAGLGATFHYEGGLQARIPRDRELECFEAWNDAWRLLPNDVEQRGEFGRAGAKDSAVAGYDSAAAVDVYERRTPDSAWVIAIGVTGDPALQLRSGWRSVEKEESPGIQLLTLRRTD